MQSTNPIIFISYAHADEPEKPMDGEVQWLSFVRRYLQPAIKDGIFDLWVDRQMMGGADWELEIEQKLRACDIFVLLVSANSMASNYIVDKEISIVLERQANGESVYFYPLLLTPTPDAGLNKVKDKNIRPRDAKPFSSFSPHDRMQHMTDAANEMAKIANQIVQRKSAARGQTSIPKLRYAHIGSLPETGYERLVGRDAELIRLSAAWDGSGANILSLIAEGGAGKSALVNEWLNRLQAHDYSGAEAVLGWSFYSQGSKKRATAADEFLNWAQSKLQIDIATTSASAKGEAIAETLMERPILLVLDGLEPLQHGPDAQRGFLRDQGLRALLRRYAAAPNSARGLIVLTSRVPVADITRWQDTTAPILNIARLSDRAGAALLRDNGVWGTDKELHAAASEFGGHALALGLLASFVKETQGGDIRRRDHIRGYLVDPEVPGHDHARRVMESYEKEWLNGQPVLLAIMRLIGLFDRPADRRCLFALRRPPVIDGLTTAIVNLDDKKWQRAVARLREVKLLSPKDNSNPDNLDAHPLLREWFGERLEDENEKAWRKAHYRLYLHLRDNTKEGKVPTLEGLSPLYQAVTHGCRAGQYLQALEEVFVHRISRVTPSGLEFYSIKKLGAPGTDLATISWFFEVPYEKPVSALDGKPKAFVLGQAAYGLRSLGRLSESIPADKEILQMSEAIGDWINCAIASSSLCASALLVGEVEYAVEIGFRSVAFADRTGDELHYIVRRALFSEILHVAGRQADAERMLVQAEQQQQKFQPEYPLLYSVQGYPYCDFLLWKGDWGAVLDRATKSLEWMKEETVLLGVGFGLLALGRAHHGRAVAAAKVDDQATSKADVSDAHTKLDAAVEHLRSAGTAHHIPRGLLARAAFRRSVGDWNGAELDLAEVEEIAEPGPMRLFICDMALERARLAFSKAASFAPLRNFNADHSARSDKLNAVDVERFKMEGRAHLIEARKLIETCGYRGRDEYAAELDAILLNARYFSDLPPRV